MGGLWTILYTAERIIMGDVSCAVLVMECAANEHRTWRASALLTGGSYPRLRESRRFAIFLSAL